MRRFQLRRAIRLLEGLQRPLRQQEIQKATRPQESYCACFAAPGTAPQDRLIMMDETFRLWVAYARPNGQISTSRVGTSDRTITPADVGYDARMPRGAAVSCPLQQTMDRPESTALPQLSDEVHRLRVSGQRRLFAPAVRLPSRFPQQLSE